MSISQLFPVSKPALNLNLAQSRRLDSRVTFTRAQSTDLMSSYVDEDGFIRYANANQPRFDHEVVVRTNLYTNSEDFSTFWSTGGVTISTNQTTAPDGTNTADKIVETSENVQHLVWQAPYGGTGAVVGEVYTMSVYAKAAERTNISLTGHGEGYAVFDLASGTVLGTGGHTNVSMVPVGNGWFRCSITITKTNTNSAFYILIWTTTNTYAGTAGSGLFLWGAQVEQGSTLTDYIRTGATQVSVEEYRSLGLLSEEARTNLITYSESSRFNQWTDNVVFSDNEIAAPDGTITGSRLTSTLTGGTNNCYLEKSFAIAADTGTYVFSVFLKKGTSPQTLINLQFYGGTYQQSRATINWTKNTISASDGGTAYLWPYGNGWYRIAISLTNNGTNNACSPRIYVRGQGTDNVSGENVFIWGWQVEKNLFPSSYVPSTDTFSGRTSTATYVDSDGVLKTAASGAARLDYNSANPSFKPKLLLEPAATNLLTYTEDFGNAIWAKGSTSVTTNIANVAAPDNLPTSDKLVENSSNAQHLIWYNRTASNETMTLSVFARAAERTRISLQFSNFTTADAIATFNLKTGKIDYIRENTADYTRTRAYIVPYQNGWYRCILTSTKGSANTTNNPSINVDAGLNENASAVSYQGNGTSGIYIWGAQLETGAYATSYVPATGASQVTRSADTSSSAQTTRNGDYAEITGANLASIYNPNEGTIIRTSRVDSRMLVGGVRECFQAGFFGPSPIANGIYVRYVDSPTVGVGYSDSIVSTSTGGGTVVDSAGTSGQTLPNPMKAFMTYKNNLSDYGWNGLFQGTDETVSLPLPSNITRFIVASGAFGGGIGTISQISYYPERLVRSQLENLTK